jgi:hypothetical protein
MKLTQQVVFDTVTAHLLNQMVPSKLKEGVCAYRGAGGLQCAVGCLISDDEYDPAMEDMTVLDLLETGQLPKRLEEHVEFLSELQMIHDDHAVAEWEDCLLVLSKTHELEWKP